MNLWFMHYREKGIQKQDVIQGKTRERAETVGKTWCGLEPGRHFIRVTPFILADESILKGATVSDLSVEQAKIRVKEGRLDAAASLKEELEINKRGTLINWLRQWIQDQEKAA